MLHRNQHIVVLNGIERNMLWRPAPALPAVCVSTWMLLFCFPSLLFPGGTHVPHVPHKHSFRVLRGNALGNFCLFISNWRFVFLAPLLCCCPAGTASPQQPSQRTQQRCLGARCRVQTVLICVGKPKGGRKAKRQGYAFHCVHIRGKQL